MTDISLAHDKAECLKLMLAKCERAVVAFSGGVDSTLLLSFAKEVLGESLVAVTVASPLVPAREVVEAQELARTLGVKHVIIPADDVMRMDPVRLNEEDRCYHCKKAILSKMIAFAAERGISCILEASNADDVGGDRPGMHAVKELGVRSPLIEAALTKAEIRALAKERGLPNWAKPANACLATRIPHGEPLTPEKLTLVERGEEALRALGFPAARLRLHGDIARIEAQAEDMERLLEPATRSVVAEKLRALGLRYITADLEGYRTGGGFEKAAG